MRVVLASALRCCLGWQCTYLNDFASNCTLHHRFPPNYTCFPVGCLRRRPGGGRRAGHKAAIQPFADNYTPEVHKKLIRLFAVNVDGTGRTIVYI